VTVPDCNSGVQLPENYIDRFAVSTARYKNLIASSTRRVDPRRARRQRTLLERASRQLVGDHLLPVQGRSCIGDACLSYPPFVVALPALGAEAWLKICEDKNSTAQTTRPSQAILPTTECRSPHE